MVSRLGSVAALLAALVIVCPRAAEACSPPLPESIEPCETLRLYTPAPAFPLQLTSALRIRNDYINEYGVHSGPSEDVLNLPEPFVLERQGDDGWQPVEYTLATEENLVLGARRIDLIEREPGQYRLSWPLSTCGEPDTDSGTGALVGEFEVTPEVPYPAQLGPIDVDYAIEEVTLHLGEAGDCTPIEANATLGRVTIELAIPEAWAPWIDAASIAVYVDGELEHGFAQVPTADALALRYTRTMDTVCASDDPSVSGGLPEGTYTVELVARIDGLSEVFSDPAEVTIDCAGLEPPGGDGDSMGGDDGAGGGHDGPDPGIGGIDDDRSGREPCAIGRPGTASGAVLAMLVLVGRRRRSPRAA